MKRLVRASYFTMLTIVGGLIKISVPGYAGTDFTFQIFFAVLAGLILGSRDGAISQLLYLALGLLGLPVFAYGGGYKYVLQPTFGYVLFFPAGAFMAGHLKSNFKTLSVNKLFYCAFFALTTIYLPGMIYQLLIVGRYLNEGFLTAMNTLSPYPFMFIVDAVLLYIACLIYPRLMTFIGKEQDVPFEEKTKLTT